MTPEKAIKFFDEEIVRLEGAPIINGCEMTDDWRGHLEICKLAKSAIEKQTPKKPKQDIYGYYQCPFCMADDYALMHDSNIADRYNYCHNCGQALDWSGTE